MASLSHAAMRCFPVLILLLIAAGCVPTTPRPVGNRTPLPAPRPAPVPPPSPVAPDWRDRPVTAGTWTYARDERGSIASFEQAGSGALTMLRCDLANRRLVLSRAGVATGPITIRTSSTTRALPTGATGGTPPYAAAVLTATDPLLDAMAFSRGRFALEQEGAPPLALPAWAEIGRVVEDCR